MNNYRITTQRFEGCPSEEIGEEEIQIVSAIDIEDLIEKLDLKLDEDGYEDEDILPNLKESNELVLASIENEDYFFYREDNNRYDNELYIWDGENSDGIRYLVELV